MRECAGGGLLERQEWHLHVVVMVPEGFCHVGGGARRGGGVGVGDAEGVGGEFGNIGEWVSDKHPCGKAAGLRFRVDGEADAFAEASGSRDEFVASDECGDADAGGDGARFSRDDIEEKACCALARLKKVDVGVGVIGDDGVALFEHAAGWDAVEVEGNHDGNAWAQDATGFGEKVAFGIEFCFSGHGAVHAEVDCVDGGRVADCI